MVFASLFLWGKDKISGEVVAETRNTKSGISDESEKRNPDPLILYKSNHADIIHNGIHVSHGAHTSHGSHYSHNDHYSHISQYSSPYNLPESYIGVAALHCRKEALKYYSDTEYVSEMSYIVKLKRFDGKSLDVVCLRLLGDNLVLYIPIGEEQDVYVIEGEKREIIKKDENHKAILDIYKDDIKNFVK